MKSYSMTPVRNIPVTKILLVKFFKVIFQVTEKHFINIILSDFIAIDIIKSIKKYIHN